MEMLQNPIFTNLDLVKSWNGNRQVDQMVLHFWQTELFHLHQFINVLMGDLHLVYLALVT